MKKLMAILVFAGVLSIPSAVFAEASWYGSLRGGVQFESDKDAKTSNYGSRWGIKGENEAGEGLTAVYKFETRIGSSVDQTANQIYVGLSGGFGNLTLGKIPGAIDVHNSMRNQAYWESGSDTLLGGRYEALSYAISTDAVSAQIDLVMDGATDTGGSIDKTAFGMTAALGDLGKISVGYENMKDMNESLELTPYAPDNTLSLVDGKINGLDGITWRDKDKNVVDANGVEYKDGYVVVDVIQNGAGDDTADGTVVHRKADDGKYYSTACNVATLPSGCTTTKKYLVKVVTVVGDDSDGNLQDKTIKPTKTYTVQSNNASLLAAIEGTGTGTVYGAKKTHISAEFGLGAVTLGLGHSQKDSNDPKVTGKTKINYLGLQGSLGDTGLNWLAWTRNIKDGSGKKTSPWMVGINKSLGGGAFTFVEHANNDDGAGGRTHVAFGVNF